MFMLILPRFASIGFVGFEFSALCENEGVFTIDIYAMLAFGVAGVVVAAAAALPPIPATNPTPAMCVLSLISNPFYAAA